MYSDVRVLLKSNNSLKTYIFFRGKFTAGVSFNLPDYFFRTSFLFLCHCELKLGVS